MSTLRPLRPVLAACLAASVVVHGGAFIVALGGPSHASLDPAARTPDPPVVTAGDTFEIPTERATDDPADLPDGVVDTAPRAESPPTDRGAVGAGSAPAIARSPNPRARTATATSARSDATPGAEGAQARSNALFGAVGERSATPLAAAFTRGFPQAASADPLWLSAPFGSAGSVDVELTLDDQGTLVSARREAGDPGPALAEALRRTLALIRARSFVASGRVTRLRVTATVTPDEVHDGLHGEVFAIGGSFEGGDGSAFFALAVGRRIDLRIRVLR